MTIEQVLKSLLCRLHIIPTNQVAPVFALERWEPPYITFRRTETIRQDNLGRPDPTAAASFRVTVWTALYDQAVELANEIRIALCDTEPYELAEGIELIECAGEQDEYDPSPELDVRRYFGRSLLLTIHYDEHGDLNVEIPES